MALLYGTWKHGYGNYDEMRKDPEYAHIFTGGEAGAAKGPTAGASTSGAAAAGEGTGPASATPTPAPEGGQAQEAAGTDAEGQQGAEAGAGASTGAGEGSAAANPASSAPTGPRPEDLTKRFNRLLNWVWKAQKQNEKAAKEAADKAAKEAAKKQALVNKDADLKAEALRIAMEVMGAAAAANPAEFAKPRGRGRPPKEVRLVPRIPQSPRKAAAGAQGQGGEDGATEGASDDEEDEGEEEAEEEEGEGEESGEGADEGAGAAAAKKPATPKKERPATQPKKKPAQPKAVEPAVPEGPVNPRANKRYADFIMDTSPLFKTKRPRAPKDPNATPKERGGEGSRGVSVLWLGVASRWSVQLRCAHCACLGFASSATAMHALLLVAHARDCCPTFPGEVPAHQAKILTPATPFIVSCTRSLEL